MRSVSIIKIIIFSAVLSMAGSGLPGLIEAGTANVPGKTPGLEQNQPKDIKKDLLIFGNIEKRIEEIGEKLKNAQPGGNQKNAVRFGITPAQLQEHDLNLRKLKTIYLRQLTAMERRDSLKKEEANLGKKLESRQETLLAQTPPYNLSFYDNLLDELAIAEKQEHTLDIAVKSEKKVVEEGKVKVGHQGHMVRDATEELQNEEETGKSLPLSWKLEYAKIEEELALAFLDLKRITAENGATELRLARLQVKVTQRYVRWVRSKLTFDQADLDNILDSLEKRRSDLQTRINTLLKEQQGIENEWLKALKELEHAQGREETVKARAAAFLEARAAWRETYQRVLEETETVLLILDQERQFWQYRYGLLKKNIRPGDIARWEKQALEYMAIIKQHIKVKEKYHTNLQSEIASIKKQLAYKNLDFGMKKNIITNLNALNKMAERGFEYLALLHGTEAVGQRLLDEIRLRRQEIPLGPRVKEKLKIVKNLWETELWVVDERSVTVRKLTIALTILIVGMLLARWLTHSIIRRALLKIRLDRSATIAIEKTIYIVALAVLSISALRSVNIPLTVFTFLGGAMAIGIGFGAQKLLNNFISGFILMVERPVKINDMIEVDNNFGIIEDIGVRCTRVRTPGNVHILVPNSSFLEKNIVNWTLSDQEIRARVILHTSHDSDPREVTKLMLKACHGHEKILKTPEAIVLFDDIQNSSFKFTAYFWVSMKNLQLLERRSIESDIRFTMIELIRRAGIAPAIPRQGVHIDTVKPVDVRLIREEDNHGRD